MLCYFANAFPVSLAGFLDRGSRLKRSFREETATDMLMSGLVGFQRYGIRVDYPDEKSTGADMDWIFATPKSVGGGSYLRFLIQAKLAKTQINKKETYWYYDHLDYPRRSGRQAQTLVNFAARKPDGMETHPLYFFYHPKGALQSKTSASPAIEGVNATFAGDVAVIVKGGCKRAEMRVEYWRSGFLCLRDLLCWPAETRLVETNIESTRNELFFLDRSPLVPGQTRLRFHPKLVAQRINDLRARQFESRVDLPAERAVLRQTDGLPDHIDRAIRNEPTKEDLANIQRPRAIFYSDFEA